MKVLVYIEFEGNANIISIEGDLWLNSPITEDKIINVDSNDKYEKAFGFGEILNKHIKSTKECLMPIYLKLFNLLIILDTVIVPEGRLTGIIITVYWKKKFKMLS